MTPGSASMRGARAVVLGGGIAGLAAAWSLRRAGAEVTLLEAAAVPGGLAGGFRDRGYTFDLFSHRLWTRDREVLDLVDTWTGAPLLRTRKVSRILVGERLYNYPLDLRDLSGAGGLRLGAGALGGYLKARVGGRDQAGERDFEGFMTARYGRPLYDVFFGPYTRKLTGLPPETLSSDLAREAIPPSGLLRQLARRALHFPDSWD
ncbi:MAG TPA: FAD-dependent oxidoreductase, partial [Dongiaceae bacterium]|nr:FAD-dependent oxidoreductase [Dongiaceae bacterium]